MDTLTHTHKKNVVSSRNTGRYLDTPFGLFSCRPPVLRRYREQAQQGTAKKGIFFAEAG